MGLGLGLGIWWPTQTSIIPGLLKALCARATYCENKLCTTATLEEIAAVRYTAPVLPTGLLADYPGASAAYSLRNLIDTTTNVVRVRRSSDNTEQDFTSTEITDGTLTTFTGANDGFVTTWYDQSGNSNDLSSSSALNQPKIVSVGVLNLDNSKPYIEYSGNDRSSNGLKSVMSLSNSNGTIFGTYNSNDTGNGLVLGTGTGGSTFVGAIFNGENSSPSGNVGSPNYYSNGVLLPSATRNDLYDNYVVNQDALMTILNCSFSAGTSWNTDVVAPYLYGNQSISHNVKAKEYIIYDSNQSANRTGIETNINTEYTIY